MWNWVSCTDCRDVYLCSLSIFLLRYLLCSVKVMLIISCEIYISWCFYLSLQFATLLQSTVFLQLSRQRVVLTSMELLKSKYVEEVSSSIFVIITACNATRPCFICVMCGHSVSHTIFIYGLFESAFTPTQNLKFVAVGSDSPIGSRVIYEH